MIENKLISQYQFFYRKITKNELYVFTPEGRQLKMVSNFAKLLNKTYKEGSIDDNFLYEYFTFQFNRFTEADTKFGIAVQLSWIIGKKALFNWQNKDDNWSYWNEEFRKRFNIVRKIPKHNLSNEYKTIERKRFYNTDMGLLHCIDLELLDMRGFECKFCKNRKICQR